MGPTSQTEKQELREAAWPRVVGEEPLPQALLIWPSGSSLRSGQEHVLGSPDNRQGRALGGRRGPQLQALACVFCGVDACLPRACGSGTRLVCVLPRGERAVSASGLCGSRPSLGDSPPVACRSGLGPSPTPPASAPPPRGPHIPSAPTSRGRALRT